MPDLPTLLRHAVASVRDPRDEARWVMSIEMPRTARWEALLLIVVISVMLAQITTLLMPMRGDTVFGPLLGNAIVAGVAQMSVLVLMVFAIFFIGRAMGGYGGFGNTIALVAWIQFVMACLQVVQTAALFLVPPIAGLIGVAGFVLFFWLLTNFVAELHGFMSLGKVFLVILLSLFGFAFGMSIILAMIGVTITGVP